MTRHTKIVATLGPATTSVEQIRALVDAGLNVARINGSHGSHDEHAGRITAVREAAASAGRVVAVLFDLQGPKIRIGRFEGERAVKRGEEIVIAVGREPNPSELPSDYPALDDDVEVGHRLLIDDGEIGTEVVAVKKGSVRCLVQNDGVIQPRKGINLPDSRVSAPAISDKDRRDAIFAAEAGVDLIALSFVRAPEDVRELEALLAQAGHRIPIIAKIEKPQALERLDEILQESWGVMVARGDLGVELPPEDVPMAQKRIIRAANRAGRPVITATQMLDSMKHSPRPTRAEASDVANAVIDGTDAVMLSGETAVGEYPVESVEMMARIISSTEVLHQMSPATRRRERHIDDVAEAVADATATVARHLEAKAIVAFTRTGASAIMVAVRRPEIPLLVFTPQNNTLHRMALVWGAQPFLLPNTETVDERVRLLDEAVVRAGLANTGDHLVMCMGAPTGPAGSTNIMMVHRVGDAELPRALS